MDTAIAVQDLRKIYKPQSDRRRQGPEIKAVDGITFEVACGEFFGGLIGFTVVFTMLG